MLDISFFFFFFASGAHSPGLKSAGPLFPWDWLLLLFRNFFLLLWSSFFNQMPPNLWFAKEPGKNLPLLTHVHASHP